MNNIDFKEIKKINKKEIEYLYKNVGWTNYTDDLDILEKALNNSLDIIGAFLDDTLIGLIRTVGDGFTIIYIQDILVLKEHQGKKIGSSLLNIILKKYEQVRMKVLLTDNTEKTVKFYKKNNFIPCNKDLIAFLKTY